jgi:hypothetical protein
MDDVGMRGVSLELLDSELHAIDESSNPGWLEEAQFFYHCHDLGFDAETVSHAAIQCDCASV